MPETGLTPAHQAPASTIGRLELAETTVTEAWQQLLAAAGVREALVDAVRDLGRDRSITELYAALDKRDLPHHVVDDAVAVCQHGRRTGWLVGHAAQLGRAKHTTVDDLLATATLFDALEDTPVLTVTVSEAFREKDRSQREDVCALLARLAQAFDVRVVATRVVHVWLAESHRELLAAAASVNDWLDAHQSGPPVESAVTRALHQLSRDSTAEEILRILEEQPDSVLPFTALHGRPALPGDSAVRKQLGRLADLGLVSRVGPDHYRRAELRDAGHAYLEAVDADTTEQRTLVDASSPAGNSCMQRSAPVQGRKEGEENAPPHQPYRWGYLNSASHAAAAACADTADVTLVEDRTLSDSVDHTRYTSFDETRDQIVVAVRATTGMQATLSACIGLASPEFLDETLPNWRLRELDEKPSFLREARCIGGISDDALNEPADLRETFVNWGKKLGEMSRDAQNGECEDREALQREILRSAHGLYGSLVHLFDAVGISVVRELRVPRGLNSRNLESVAKAVGYLTAIQSHYAGHNAYRALYETRDEKRSRATPPTIDAADPLGSFIGSVVLRGPDVHRLQERLDDYVGRPAELVEDAPEFAVPITVAEAGRGAVARAAKRALDTRRLDVTRPAVSLLHGLLGSPYLVAQQLWRLDDEAICREVQPRELRYVLAMTPAEHLLPNLPPTIGKVVAALLEAEQPLTQRDLADRAGVSTRSVRTHRETLDALGLVRINEDGWRFTLPFRTDDETEYDLVPDAVRGEVRLTDAVSDVLAAVLPAAEYAEPGGIVDAALSYPPDPWALAEHPALSPWLELVAALVDADPPDEPSSRTVTMGPTLEQQPLGTAPLADHPTPTPSP